jgi:hypothetical protein
MDLKTYNFLWRIGALIEPPEFYTYLSAAKNQELLANYSGLKLSSKGQNHQIGEIIDLVEPSERFASKGKIFNQGKIFFKSPDRFKFKATRLALLPQKSLNFLKQKILLQPHTAHHISLDYTKHLLKIVPMTAGIDYVIASLRENEQKCNF